MDKEKLTLSLIEAGVPEEKVADIISALEETNAEITRQHEAGVNEPIDMGGGIYLSHLLSDETDWKKRAAISAAIISRGLGT
ncbi:MAG: hypothetical protein Q7K40_01245 [bacterium]|nr:hypothetical protein [bacterium]